MKKFLDSLGTWLLGVLLVLALPLILLIRAPINRYRYRKTRYYRDTGHRYRFWRRDLAKLYDRIQAQGLPITYACQEDYEYFLRDGIVLLYGWDKESLEQRDGVWGMYMDNERVEDEWVPLDKLLEEERQKLKPEHRQLSVFFLDTYEVAQEEQELCPYFCRIEALQG